MSRLCFAILVLSIALLSAASTTGQDKKPEKDEPKAKGMLPPNWKKLGLSEEQTQKVYKTQAAYKAKIEKLQKEIDALKAEEKAELLKVLTDKQKEDLKKILLGDTSKEPVKDKVEPAKDK